MQTDLFGRTRYQVNLHMHTTLSDGKVSPAEALQIYRAQGYDAVAMTDHWFFGEGREEDDIILLSGAEYNIGGADGAGGVYHILSIGARYAPSVHKSMDAQGLIDAIHNAGGMAVLAHPAWSLNTPEMIAKLRGVDAVEIYNTVSGVGNSRRPDSSLIVDMLGCMGLHYPLLAADDAHYYTEAAKDSCRSWIMVEAEDNTRESLLRAIRAKRFYATQGPEAHITWDGERVTVQASPVSEIVLFSNSVWSRRTFVGEGLTEAHYVPQEHETYVRAQVTDASGKCAWTNALILDRGSV